MATKKGTKGAGTPKRQAPHLPRELIFIAKPEAGLRAAPTGMTSLGDADIASLNQCLAECKATAAPLFGAEDKMLQEAAQLKQASITDVPDLSVFYRVEADEDRLDELAGELAKLDVVEAAYIKPPAEPSEVLDEAREITGEMEVQEIALPAITPDFTSRQGYLDSALGGIDARYAWTQPGGSGANVRIIDIEGAWNFTHEDLLQNQSGLLGGTQSADIGWRNHGTAVFGVMGGDRNSFGITGICPDASLGAISIFGGMGSAGAIRLAADRLRAGDIILIELHRAGPRHNFQGRGDQKGYIAIEWWPDDFAAIRYANSKGVIVVEAAGNGAENLDDAIYENPGPGFPASWTNPFRRSNRDSGAIVVGAGAPPPGTHGRDYGADRSRLDFSNYGALLDAQGWGREVTSTGYGNLQNGPEDRWYTDRFSGTSSASPIVVGALADLQGVARARGQVMTPALARQRLRVTGSPQTDGPNGPRTQRIGSRPNLRQLIGLLGRPRVRTTPLYRYWNKRIGDHFYTTNWRELGRGRYGWRYEGVQCRILPQRLRGTVPLFRYWNARIGDHFYTTNWRELGRGRHGWRYEGIQGYVSPRRIKGTQPLYRYWNRRIGDHFYTTNWNELRYGRAGWRYEGVQCYVYPARVRAIPEAPTEEEIGEPIFEGVAQAAPESASADLGAGIFGLEEIGTESEASPELTEFADFFEPAGALDAPGIRGLSGAPEVDEPVALEGGSSPDMPPDTFGTAREEEPALIGSFGVEGEAFAPDESEIGPDITDAELGGESSFTLEAEGAAASDLDEAGGANISFNFNLGRTK